MLELLAANDGATRLTVRPADRAIVCWNSLAVADTIELTVHTLEGLRSRALPYAVFEAGARASLDGFDNVARIETDIVKANGTIVAIDVSADRPLVRVTASTPSDEAPRTASSIPIAAVRELAVPMLSQYVDAHPEQRGWCAPASIAMLAGACGIARTVADVANGVFDRAYNGTGNWAFAVAYAGALGLTGAAAYLRDLTTAQAFIAGGLALAASISWKNGELPGAPLAASDGHLLVIRGFTAGGDVIVNDPAQAAIRHIYPRASFERCWLNHGGVALLVAPEDRTADMLACANA